SGARDARRRPIAARSSDCASAGEPRRAGCSARVTRRRLLLPCSTRRELRGVRVKRRWRSRRELRPPRVPRALRARLRPLPSPRWDPERLQARWDPERLQAARRWDPERPQAVPVDSAARQGARRQAAEAPERAEAPSPPEAAARGEAAEAKTRAGREPGDRAPAPCASPGQRAAACACALREPLRL